MAGISPHETEGTVARAAKVVQGHDEELNYPDPSQAHLMVDDLHAKDLERLHSGLETLPPWQAEVLRRHFGLHGTPRKRCDPLLARLA